MRFEKRENSPGTTPDACRIRSWLFVGLDACELALIMAKSFLRRVSNRILQFAARVAPGSQSFRPLLHRLRGVSIGKNVFIGDDVYLENEYPECVEIQDNV